MAATSLIAYTAQEAENFQAQQNGIVGSTYFGDTNARTGAWSMVQVITTAVFATLTDATRDGTTLTGVSIPVGTILKGHFTAITMTSGTCIAYKG